MNSKWRRFAPLGLYLAGLAALVSIGLYIVQREWNLYLQISLGLVVVGLALFAVLDPERVRVALTGRQARYGSNALVMSVAFIGILVVVNFLIYKNPKRWDLTEDKQNTLTKETQDTLKSLPSNVVAQAFFTSSYPSDTARGILEQYKFSSNGKFDYRFIDPNSDPVSARDAGITADGTIILKMGDRQEKITTSSETDITSALVRLMAEKQTVYFLTGHGEYSPDATGDQSYSKVKTTLESKNYTVKLLNLLADNQIPTDAKEIVIAGPTKPVTDNEVKLLSDFQDKGGSLIVMEEPTLRTDFGDAPDPLAKFLSDKWGIILGADIVVDPTANQAYSPYAASYGSHAITNKLQSLGTAFPTVRSVSIGNPITGVTDTELIKTADQSWGETDIQGLKSGQQPQADASKDFIGPVPLAIAGENSSSKSKIVVIGDSDFAIDVNFSFLGNGDLLINSIDWAAGQANLINLTPKQPIQRILLPPQKYTVGMVLLGSVFVIPGMVLVAGVVVWFQRRRKG